MQAGNITRRRFLQTAQTLSAAGLLLPLSSIANKQSNIGKQKKLGVALVGLGYYSRDLLAPALQLTQLCELRGIVTGSPEKIPVWQEKYGIKDANVYNYANMHTVADNTDIDVIYVVVPTALHKKYSLIAANAGKHVWCEKPMAMTVTECEDIIQACQKNRVKLSIGYRMQHEPNTQTVMQYARNKPYGNIKKVKISAGYGGRGGPGDNWRMQKHMGGGAMYDMGVYSVNAARYATAMEPVSITARHHNTLPEVFKEVDPTTYFALTFPGDLMADCMTSVVIGENRLHVDCNKGWYYLEPMQSYHGVAGATSDGIKLDKYIANQQARQMDNDAQAIIENLEVRVPGEEGLKDIHIVEAAFKSASTGKAVAL